MRWIAMVTAALVLGACGTSSPDGSSDGSPASAMETFLDAVHDRDCDAMRAVVLSPSEFDCSLVEAYGSLFGELDPDEATIEEASRAGSSAVVSVTWPTGSSNFEVQENDGNWLVVLDSAA